MISIVHVFLGLTVCSQNPTVTKENESYLKLLRMPYLQCALSDSVSILWRTNYGNDCAVQYKSVDENEWQKQKGIVNITNNVTVENTVTLSGLKEGQKYNYRIFTDNTLLAPEKKFELKAHVSDKKTPFSFYAGGDIGQPLAKGGKQYLMAKTIMERPTTFDFGLLLGDIVYPNGESEGYDLHLFPYFEDVFSNAPVYAVIGNHDWHVDPEQNFRQEWKLPGNEHYYSFDYANTHFIALDSKEGDFYEHETQMEWFKTDLEEAQGKYDWIIVLIHHNGKSCTYKPDYEIVMDLYTLYEKYGVDLVLNGHAHTYERLNPMNGNGEVLEGSQDEIHNYGEMDGFISITAGSGGKLYDKNGYSLTTNLDSLTCKYPNLVAAATHATQFLEVTISGKVLSAKSIETVNGEETDSFTIRKK